MQSRDSNVYSVIDLGTNTCLLLIAKPDGSNLQKLHERQEIPRIGRDLFKTGKISENALESTIKIFRDYISDSDTYHAGNIYAFGTSALREAENSEEFVDCVHSETGIRINVISGEQEAEYGFKGATYDLDHDKKYAVIDIGGGSTEISFKDNSRVKGVSIDTGSVRLFENFFKDDFNESAIARSRKFIRSKLTGINVDMTGLELAGIAGTVTTLSAIKNGLDSFNESVIHKDELTKLDVEQILRKLLSMSNEERLNIGSYMKGRSDIICSGTLILDELLNHFDKRRVIVSTKGLRYGLMFKVFALDKLSTNI